MPNKTQEFIKLYQKKNIPDVKPGDTVSVHQKIPAFVPQKSGTMAGKKEGNKEKSQVFEGLVIARKHGKGISSTITIRKVIAGIWVEKVFPLHSPLIEKIEIKKRGRVRRAKLYYLRKAKGKKARLKRKEFIEAIGEPVAEISSEKLEETVLSEPPAENKE